MDRFYILDGYGYIFRAFYALSYNSKRPGVNLSTKEGLPTGALHVYAAMLVRLLQDVKPERVVVVFDAPGRTFREDLSAEYKATRSETPSDLILQMPHFRPLTEAFAWPVVAIPGVEADDVIATLTRKARAKGWPVTIFSGDKDLMQLVDEDVVVIDSMRQLTYGHPEVVEKFGVTPSQLEDFLAMVGDTSDNIPGLSGIGKVTAAKLLNQYNTLDGVLANVGALKGKLKTIFENPEEMTKLALSRQLVKLKRDVELDFELEHLVAKAWDRPLLRDLLTKFEFHQLVSRLGLNTDAPTAAAISPSTDGSQPAPESPIQALNSAPAAVVLDAELLAAVTREVETAKRIAVWMFDDGARIDRAIALGIGLLVAERTYYIPLHHRYLAAPPQLPGEQLAQLFAALSRPDLILVCHEKKRLLRLLYRLGAQHVEFAEDVELLAYLADSSKDAYSLKELDEEYGDRAIKSNLAVSVTESTTVEEAAEMARRGLRIVDLAQKDLQPKLRASGQEPLYRELELPLATLLAKMEDAGVLLDAPLFRQLSHETISELAAIEKKIFEHAGTDFNVGSPKQLGMILFEKMGLTSERMKKKKTGYSTDHEVLEAMADIHPIVELILEHRELTKLRGTYLEALPPLTHPKTGRLHTSFRQAVAATGRISSTDPNLQNIPIRSTLGKKIRRGFIAPQGMQLISADYSQIELRILAHLSQDPVLLSAFSDDLDIHGRTAAEVFAVAQHEVTSEQRRIAKAVNYGLVYGQTDFGLSRALGIARGDAKEYIERYFARFSTIKSFMDGVIAQAKSKQGAHTVLGRFRPIPGLNAKEFRVRTAAERIALNTPMQGSGADIMKLAMLRVDAALTREKLAARILLTVHDELVLEVEQRDLEPTKALVKQAMENAISLSVPLKVDIGHGTTWADAH